MGIQAKRKRVAAWEEAEVKASGVVVGRKKRLNKKGSDRDVREDKEGRPKKRRADEPLSGGHKVVGGVMHGELGVVAIRKWPPPLTHPPALVSGASTEGEEMTGRRERAIVMRGGWVAPRRAA